MFSVSLLFLPYSMGFLWRMPSPFWKQYVLFGALFGSFWLLNSRPSYYVNRDTLFCYHKASEVFLQRLMALYVASHYKVTAASPWLNFSSDIPFFGFSYLLLPDGSGDHCTGT